MKDGQRDDRIICIFSANRPAEAVVIRSLLESAGIRALWPEPAIPLESLFKKVNKLRDIVVLESQADEARKIIADYLEDEPKSDASDQ
ncbi:MAG TPA: DUF2007 domain-containing protein [Candidatus Acidoferrales bacterium]|nr:DUF2007 domain-containing protein [Candidatus Acidoferrales bacterium]